MHTVSDLHHCMQHTQFIVYVVQDCQTMGWQAGCVLTLSLPGSVHGIVHIQHWCLLVPLSGSDLPPTISRHSSRADRDKNGETTTVADYGDERVNGEHMMGAGHKGVASGAQYHNGRQDIIMTDRMDQAGALRPDVTTTVADYGDEQVNQEQTTGAEHKGVASGTRYNNGRHD
jgi:hypothetical protein